MGPSRERMFNLVSIVGQAQEPSSTAAAACRNWPVVRGNSTSAKRGASGSAVSAWAAATSSTLRASSAFGKARQKFRDLFWRCQAEQIRRLRCGRQRGITIRPGTDGKLVWQQFTRGGILGAEGTAGDGRPPFTGDENSLD